jgi:NAD(P)-dependent dehydrogenase (short-subunit alcohol dehydrogenase family)
MKQLKDRIAVVTGAGSGIGRALSILLAEEGCHLAIADINRAGLAETQELLAKYGRKVSAHSVDVSKKERMQDFVGEVLDAHGGVNIVVNNAGVAVAKTFVDHSLEDFEWLMSINFWGVIYGCKLFLPHLLNAEEGHIVNISSLFGLVGVPMQTSYCASKFAVRGFSEALRAELGSSKVGVSSVHPGGIATNIAAASRHNEDAESEKMHKRSVTMFKKMMPASAAAARIVSGIKKNKGRVLITRETYAMDFAKRIAPNASNSLVAWGFERMTNGGNGKAASKN